MTEVRVLKKTDDFIFVELSPYEQLISVGERHDKFILPLPWTYYVFEMNTYFKSFRCQFIAGSPKQLKTLTNPKLYVLPLPNVYGRDLYGFGNIPGKMCSPWQNIGKEVYKLPEEEIALSLVARFWEANFPYFEAPGKCHKQLALRSGFGFLGYTKYPPRKMYKYWASIDLEKICRKRWIKSTPVSADPNIHFK